MSALWMHWKSIWRFHALLAGTLVLEYALTFAIMTGATGVLIARIQAVTQKSGVDEAGLYVVRGRSLGLPIHRTDLFAAKGYFQSVADKGEVALGSNVPYLGSGGQSSQVSAVGNAITSGVRAEIYLGDVNFSRVLGLRLLHGRWFHADEVTLRYGDPVHLGSFAFGVDSIVPANLASIGG